VATRAAKKSIVLHLEHDDTKTLQKGKRRYGDEDRHNIYFTGEEVAKLGSPDRVKVTVEPDEE
jgi:hypothetical protein